MGVLNVTPDSFSDGGSYVDADAAIAHGMDMLDQGADIIDVGGESTRPGFSPVSPEEEARRVVPVVAALAEAGAIVSIDTRHAPVARACLEAGASIVNDVEGFTDPEMVQVACEYDCGVVVMHWNQTTGAGSRRSVTLDPTRPAQARLMAPSNRRFTLPEEAPIMREVMGFLGDQARKLMRAGVSHDRICIDPGPGFDKTTDTDVVIQRNTHKLVSMGYPVLCAVSRKRFVGALSGVTSAPERDAATAGVVLSAIESGARTVDCDLCWLEGEEHAGRHLTLPHPGLGERDYVLVPMEDLMSDPERFLAHAGVEVKPFEERVGKVLADLGPVDWR